MSGRAETGDARWPVAIALSLFLLAASALALFHPSLLGPAGAAVGNPLVLLIGLIPLLAAIAAWSMARRGRQRPARAAETAVLAFIASEAMFFAAFFAVYLQFAIYPEIAGLTSWPPAGMRPDDPWGGPLLNTVLLVVSGGFVALAHHAFLKGDRPVAAGGLAVAVLLGLAFLALQLREFHLATQAFSDGVYASVFFLATGFHGLHVLIGATLLSICFIRVWRGAGPGEAGFFFNASAWYWHFVDAVWLLLFVVFYAWT